MLIHLLRKLFILSITIFTGYSSYSQSAAINIDGSAAAASAALDIKSSTKGLLIPRMLASQRILIGSPAEGLLVYQTDAPAGFYYYKAGAWTSITPTSSGWNLAGNAGTADGTNFIGTTDNIPFNIRVNNQRAGRIDPALLSTSFGYQAGNAGSTGTYNTAIGQTALSGNSTGYYNTANGYAALSGNNIGNNNTANGVYALSSNTTGSYNTADGQSALYSNIGGFNNTAIGYAALSASTGSNNTGLGSNAGPSGGIDNSTAIGFSAVVNASNKVQIGNNLVNSVQLGTGANVTLETGLVKLTGGSPGPGKVLTSDGSGLASWQTNAGAGWGLSGNAGTVDGTNFIGTTDNIPFNIRVNNEKAGRIDVSGNTFYGYQAGNTNTGAANTATGFLAFKNNTTGAGNTANGTNALTSNSIGDNNTAFGNSALYSNSAGIQNTATGVSALALNNTGNNNTANGYQALYNNTANNNTANGYQALFSNTTGSLNTANGYQSLFSNSTGGSNTANGNRALYNNSTGTQNTANGNIALFNNIDGKFNTGVGYAALFNNSTGDANIAIGWNALFNNTTGSSNTAIGWNSDVSTSAITNATALGAVAIVNASHKIRLGSTGVTVIEGQVSFSSVSDGRFKTNISESDVKGLDFISRLRPVVYNFDTKKFQGFLTKDMADSVRQRYMKTDFTASTGIRQSGFVAQEVEKAAIASGYNFNGIHKPENDNDNYSLAYSQFVVPLVKGMQEQQQMITKQQQEIEAMKKQIAELIKQKK